MYCQKCGRMVEEGKTFCPFCGSSMQTSFMPSGSVIPTSYNVPPVVQQYPQNPNNQYMMQQPYPQNSSTSNPQRVVQPYSPSTDTGKGNSSNNKSFKGPAMIGTLLLVVAIVGVGIFFLLKGDDKKVEASNENKPTASNETPEENSNVLEESNSNSNETPETNTNVDTNTNENTNSNTHSNVNTNTNTNTNPIKELTCTRTTQDEYSTNKTTNYYTFKNNQMASLRSVQEVTMKKGQSGKKSSLLEAIKKANKPISSLKGVSISTKNKSNGFVYEVKIPDVTTIDQKKLNKAGYPIKNYSSAKLYAYNEGYKCS